MPAKKPLVSIIIPCYNYGRFLGKTIESTLSQSYKNIEVLVVDDGSTDGSAEVGRQHAKKDKCIRVFVRPHMGRSAALNYGISRAKGTYIARLDADDLLHRNFIKDQLSVLEAKNDIAFTYTNAKMFGTAHSVVFCQPFNPKKLFYSSGFFSTAIFRKTVFDRVGGYDESMDTAEDWELYLRCAEQGLHGFLIPRVLFYYRRHKNNNIKNSIFKGLRAYWKIIRKHRKHYPLPKSGAVLANAFLIWFLGTFWPLGHDIVRKKLYEHGIGAFYYKKKQS